MAEDGRAGAFAGRVVPTGVALRAGGPGRRMLVFLVPRRFIIGALTAGTVKR